ncbi:hypothetical protein AGDE_06202 [Angomonas deanei]|nr:hypothetical protein AGDE_06202 [Angomonas deanei]|eukprot:EPY37732.1 hypothetical protein AGDE_06202 [Angomonas deanei]
MRNPPIPLPSVISFSFPPCCHEKNSIRKSCSVTMADNMDNRDAGEFWTNPVDHFRPNLKALSLYFDHNYLVDRWLHVKERWLRPFYLPSWTPMYQFGTWYSQRNRNLLLVENNLNYRPYRFRRNDEDRENPY